MDPELFEAFQKKFGSYAQIDQVSRKINVPEEVLYRDWSARQFWFKHIYLAWEGHHTREYNKAIQQRFNKK